MPCVFAKDLSAKNMTQKIIEQISGAFSVIADVSGYKQNICLEVGVATGAGKELHLIAEETENRKPFMFNTEVEFYEDDATMIGNIHRIVYPYRRRILNYELPKAKSP